MKRCCSGFSLVPRWSHFFIEKLAWNAPPAGHAKINVHFARGEAQNGARNANGVGVIVRDSQGQMIWAALGPLNSMTEVEALARGGKLV